MFINDEMFEKLRREKRDRFNDAGVIQRPTFWCKRSGCFLSEYLK